MLRRGNDLGSGGSVAALDRALRRAASLVYGLEERVRTAAECRRAGAWRRGGDAVWADVREAGHPDYRGQFAASERTRRTGAWHASGSAGEETAAGRDSELPPSQCVFGVGLTFRAPPAVGGRGNRPRRLSPATTGRPAT